MYSVYSNSVVSEVFVLSYVSGNASCEVLRLQAGDSLSKYENHLASQLG
jgi:hypothetical protein